MIWDSNFALEIIPPLLKGLRVTILITLGGTAFAILLGLGFSVAIRSSNTYLRTLTIGLSEFVRRTPLLVQLYFIFYVLPSLGILLSPTMSGIVGLGLHSSTYMAQVFRAGIDNVSDGQRDAAQALNYTSFQTWLYVILPQAIKPIIPAIGNYAVLMLKESAILSAITVPEVMTVAKSIANNTYRFLEPMTMVGALYLGITLPLVWIIAWLERKYATVK